MNDLENSKQFSTILQTRWYNVLFTCEVGFIKKNH